MDGWMDEWVQQTMKGLMWVLKSDTGTHVVYSSPNWLPKFLWPTCEREFIIQGEETLSSGKRLCARGIGQG